MLKALGFAALALILLEPLLTGSRPRRGANAFVDPGRQQPEPARSATAATPRTRGDWVRDRLGQESPWKTRLGQDFDVRNYVFDSHLRAVDGFDAPGFDGTGSLAGDLALGASRSGSAACPLAGVLLVHRRQPRPTWATSTGRRCRRSIPSCPPSRGVARDVGVARRLDQPDQLRVGPGRRPGRRRGRRLPRASRSSPSSSTRPARTSSARRRQPTGDGKPLSFRFQFRPERRASASTRVRAFAASEEAKAEAATSDAAASSEQTLANNSRLVVVDQGGGPYRVLYVSGRPNWEFKFLRRALDDDEQIQLVGLLRIARRQPKFDFQSAPATGRPARSSTASTTPTPRRPSGPTSRSWSGSDTLDEVELRDGFPKAADELYRYHAIVLDDLEAGFFTPGPARPAAELRRAAAAAAC